MMYEFRSILKLFIEVTSLVSKGFYLEKMSDWAYEMNSNLFRIFIDLKHYGSD